MRVMQVIEKINKIFRKIFVRSGSTNEQLEIFKKKSNDFKDKLDKISDELLNVGHIDNVFWQIESIISTNPIINHDAVFQNWIATTYIDSIMIRLRRFSDNRRGCISLVRLLKEMKKYSVYFTRDSYLKAHEQDFKRLAEGWFDNIAGKGKSIIPKARFAEIISKLELAMKKIDKHVNTRIAHFSETQSADVLTFKEIREAIVVCFNIFNWCNRVIKQSVYHSPVPQPQQNWLQYLKVPWIVPASTIPSYRHLNEIIELSENI